MRDELTKKIQGARLELLMQQSFFGTLAMMLKLVDVTDQGWCPTAAVDGRNIFYNRDFFNSLTQQEIKFVICHEILHVVFDHIGRRSHRDPDWYNMAADYVINGLLVTEKIGTMPARPIMDTTGKENVQRVGLYDVKYTKPQLWTSEAVYEDLERRKVKKEMTMDVHIKPSASGSGNAKSDAPGKDPVLTDGDLEKLRKEVKEKIVQAAQAAAGNMPASLKRMIDDLIEPKINWRDLLKQNIQSCIKDDFTFAKTSRRTAGSGIFLPTLRKDETIDIAIAIDMSGSISDEMSNAFLAEVRGIMEDYDDFNISIVCFDTHVYNFKTFTVENADEILTYECVGGGGTDFTAFWNYWIKHEIDPKKAVVFTDGYPCGTWGPESYADTLWIIVDGKRANIEPPFGEWAYFDINEGIVN